MPFKTMHFQAQARPLNQRAEESLTQLSHELNLFAEVIQATANPLNADLLHACSLFSEYLRSQLREATLYLCYSQHQSASPNKAGTHHNSQQLQQLNELLILKPDCPEQALSWQARLLSLSHQLQEYRCQAA